MSMSIKADLLALFEDDRKLKNLRFQEVFHLIDSNKQLLNEHISQQFESLKALTRAFVNKEIAERMSGDNIVMAEVNKRLDGFDQVFDAKIKKDMKQVFEEMTGNTKELERVIAEAKGGKEAFESDVKKILQPSLEELQTLIANHH